ncbi:thioredoxin family protein [Spirosoma arcticum]
MKKAIWLLTILFVGFTTASTQAVPFGDIKPTTKGDDNGIQFTDAAWKDILKKAKAEKKIIFLDAYASWCGPCKTLQKKVFTQKAVGDLYNARFINVKMDMEKGEGPALSQLYPLEAYPTMLYIDSDGRVLKKIIGLHTPEDLIAIGKSVKQPQRRSL